LVGAPIATLLLREGATVTVCHSQTENVPEKSRTADILIVAIGRPHFVTKDYVSSGQTVVDVGINSVQGEKLEEEIPKRRLVGDVDFEGVKDIVGAISPVPGGVGPMTVLSLFENLIDSV
jgi:methylenetetrahydrofolate dehydrogenase (NADP+)/methenyltetrahydrofolate cyclohydrolase